MEFDEGTNVRSAAQNAASLANIGKKNRISRESKGNTTICLFSFFALVHQGQERHLPASVVNSHHSMRSWMDGLTLMHEINTNDFLAMFEYFYKKEKLSDIRKKMRTVNGRAEVLRDMIKKLTTTGTVKHKTDSTFQFGNDYQVQNDLYRAAAEGNRRLCFFNDAITMQHMNNPRLLTRRAEDGGAPVQNATNQMKNKAYADSIKPGYYVGDDLDEEDKLAQNGVGPAMGRSDKYCYADLRQLREDWEALPQGSKRALSITLKNGRRVTYK